MPKIQENSRSGACYLILPAQVARAKGFRKGSSFVVTETKNGLSFTLGSGKGALKLQKSGEKGSFYLTISKKIMKEHGWSKGDSFVLADVRNGVKYTRGVER